MTNLTQAERMMRLETNLNNLNDAKATSWSY